VELLQTIYDLRTWELDVVYWRRNIWVTI
jgi:hypothetical protein